MITLAASSLTWKQCREHHIPQTQQLQQLALRNNRKNGILKFQQKVNQTANTWTGLPQATATNHADVIAGMIREWYEENNNTTLPQDLMALAPKAGIDPAEIIPNCLTTPRRGKN
jgi:hypothetical protein